MTIEIPDPSESMRDINNRMIAEQGLRDSIERTARAQYKGNQTGYVHSDEMSRPDVLAKELESHDELIEHYKNGGTFESFWHKYYEEWKNRLEFRRNK